MEQQIDLDIIAVMNGRGKMITAHIASVLCTERKQYRGSISTSKVLSRMKYLEKNGKVERAPTNYLVQICWRLVA